MSCEKCNKEREDKRKQCPHSTDQSQVSLKSSFESPNATLQASGNISVQQFAELYAYLDSADVSIFCGKNCDVVRAHRCVLTRGSVYFREALAMAPCEHPAIVVRGISGNEMSRILDYLYMGQITLLDESELKQFLSNAKYLKLVDIEND